MDSILDTIKKMLGVDPLTTSFDTDIVVGINSAMMSLNQLAIGPAAGFSIQDATAVWTDFLEEKTDLEGVKAYIYLKVRLFFDPPATSFVIEAIKDQIKELEFRLNVQAESGTYTPIPVEGGEDV